MYKNSEEHKFQVAVFEVLELFEDRYPELKSIYAIPNGASVKRQQDKNGKWFSIEGNYLKAEGRKAGVPDIVCPYSDGAYSSLYIENKAHGKSLSPQQKIRIPLLESLGNKVMICYSSKDVLFEIYKYTFLRYTALLNKPKLALKFQRDMKGVI